jgi:hypothetical protein
MKNEAISLLLDAQQELNRLDTERADEYDNPLHCNDFRNRLLFADVGNGLAIEYFGEVWQDGDESAWSVIQQTLSNPIIADRLTSLRITGPDEGANGSRTHEFDELLQSKTTFPKLLELYIRPTGASDHNFVGIEEGQASPLIAICPNLEALTLPQAPEPDFFKIQLKQLRYARFGMAWQTFGFIRNMALHHNMPSLRVLDFADSLNVFQPPKALPGQKNTHKPIELPEASLDFFRKMGYGDAEFAEMQATVDKTKAELKKMPLTEFDDSVTPFEDYCELLKSPAIHEGMVVHLRNALLDETQFKQLNGLKDVQLSVSLEAPHVYISHWESKFATPYKHLIIPR